MSREPASSAGRFDPRFLAAELRRLRVLPRSAPDRWRIMETHEPTTLVGRIAASNVRRVAILGLTRGAGKTTTFAHLVRGLSDAVGAVAVAASGREEEDVEFTQPPRGASIALRAGTVVGTTAPALERSTAKLEMIEKTAIETPQGPLLIARVLEEGEVDPVGPASASDLREVVERLEKHAGGHVLIEGSFNRRSFAAPGIADGIILAVGAALAPEIERVVAGTRFYLDLFTLRACAPEFSEIFNVAETEGAAVLVGRGNEIVGGIPWRARGNAALLLQKRGVAFTHLVLPRSVGDDFVIPLLRQNLRFEMVVRDPMRIALSPVYYSAWQKRGGGISVVHPARVLALSVNPTNPAGPDQDPDTFLKAFRESLGEIPCHDVVREEAPSSPRRRWFGIGGGEES